MGAYTCQFGIVHKMCRCPTPHTIVCDAPLEHGGTSHLPGTSNTHAPCYRMAMGLLGKHEVHETHFFWYTSTGGGHYLANEPSGGIDNENNCRRWICPGRL